MRRAILMLAAAVAVAVGCAAGSWPAGAASVETHRYVANDFYFVGTAIASNATGIALQGEIHTVPASDHLTLTIDDAVISGRTMHVDVSGRTRSQHLCVAENTPTLVTGLTPGEVVTIWVMDPTFRNDCEVGATTGVLTISQ